MICWSTYLPVYLSVPHTTPTHLIHHHHPAPRWGFYSNPIPNILLGPPRDKAYWGMLVYPYELNGPQLYQDHPAGQGCSVRGYDVGALTHHMHAHMLRCAQMHARCLSFSPNLTYDKTSTLQIVYGLHIQSHPNQLTQQNFKTAFPSRL